MSQASSVVANTWPLGSEDKGPEKEAQPAVRALEGSQPPPLPLQGHLEQMESPPLRSLPTSLPQAAPNLNHQLSFHSSEGRSELPAPQRCPEH